MSLEVTIQRGIVYGDDDLDAEMDITVEGRVDADGRAEIVSAYRTSWNYWKNATVEQEIELSPREEERALELLERKLPEYLAERAEQAHDAMVDRAREEA